MATQQKTSGGGSLLNGLRNSPQTKLLAQQARHLLDAQADRVASRVGGGVGGATEKLTEKLTEVGQTGQLPGVGEGAKRLLQGQSPARAALGSAKEGVIDKAKNLFKGKGSKGKSGQPKVINIEESLDIGVPVSVAYDQWTQFQDFSRFMKGVEGVDQTEETELTWRVKVFKSRRSWKANIVEQIPDRRIVWTSDGPKGSTKGVVTFHPLADDLTRVLVAIEYYPNGVMEKTGNIWRAGGRRIRLDLKNFRRFVMMENEPTGSWRGEIREGEVVKGPEEGSGRPSEQGGGANSESQPRKSSNARPRKSSGRSSSPAKKSASGSPAKKSASGSPAKKSTSAARKSTSSSQARKSSPRKSTSSRTQPRKSSGESPPRKSTSGSRPRKSTSQSSRTRSAGSRSSSSAKKSTSSRSSGTKRSSARKRSS
ncbi:MAG TPA: SRPBCC family protein [Jatrophihabitans sp.]|jgi:uncharacterized membrane protein|nr:SRPBCC family protein [Jatrophihabitans sp.]